MQTTCPCCGHEYELRREPRAEYRFDLLEEGDTYTFEYSKVTHRRIVAAASEYSRKSGINLIVRRSGYETIVKRAKRFQKNLSGIDRLPKHPSGCHKLMIGDADVYLADIEESTKMQESIRRYNRENGIKIRTRRTLEGLSMKRIE